jgi:hypothetical protein
MSLLQNQQVEDEKENIEVASHVNVSALAQPFCSYDRFIHINPRLTNLDNRCQELETLRTCGNESALSRIELCHPCATTDIYNLTRCALVSNSPGVLELAGCRLQSNISQ